MSESSDAGTLLIGGNAKIDGIVIDGDGAAVLDGDEHGLEEIDGGIDVECDEFVEENVDGVDGI